MHKSAKTITEENFPVFKKLVAEVILKATGKPVLKNPAISEVISKKTGEVIKYLPEAKAKEIIIKITNQAVDEDNRGRRLQAIINAALNDDITINARLYTLDLLAEYVLRNGEGQSGKNDESNEVLNWKTYLEKHKHLLLQHDSDDTLAQEEISAVLEIDKMPIVQSEDKISAEELNNREPEIPENINILGDFENSRTNNASIKKIERKFMLAGMKGGIYAGILASIIIALVRYINGKNITPFSTGYENMNFDKFMKYIFTPLLLFQMIAGALLGVLCCYGVVAKNKFFKSLLLFISSFIVIVVVRQSMVRDAWYFPGTYPYYDKNGNIVRMGGGLLGEPDFETLAVGFMGAIGIFILVHAFRKSKLAVLKARETFELSIKTIIYCSLAWCVTYGFYILLAERLRIIHKGEYLIAPSFFTVDFPHPERPIFAIALCMIYVFCFIISIRYYFNNRKE